MVGFHSKEISNPPSLGEHLRNCRETSGLSLAEVAKATGISVKYLSAIEGNNFNELPGEVYAKNFLRVYTKYLDLNCDESLALYQTQQKIYSKTKNQPLNDFKKPVKRISSFHFLVTPKIVRGAIIALLAVICLFYLGFKIKAIMAPPSLTVDQPVNNLVTANKFIEVTGQVESGVTIEINGQQVLTDRDNKFFETIDLQSGVNIIEIKAKKRHGRETKIYRQVVLIDQEGENN